MPDCQHCSQTFEKEIEYRAHLYHDHDRENLGRIAQKRVGQSLDTLTSNATADLEECFQNTPTVDTLTETLATYEHVLSKTLEWEDFDTLRELALTYYEPLVSFSDEVIKTEGWPALAKVIEDYDPRDETPPPGLCLVTVNVCGRYVIRTRISDDVESIPPRALDYLQVFADRDLPIENRRPVTPGELSLGYLEWEGSYAYGWGIGHPEHDVAARLQEVARSPEPAWCQSTLQQAFYADQSAATNALEQILQDPNTDDPFFFLHAVPDDESGIDIQTRYWDWQDEVTIEYTLDPEVVERLQTCIREHLCIEVPEEIPLGPADP